LDIDVDPRGFSGTAFDGNEAAGIQVPRPVPGIVN
jgi:hypothetical protein